MIITLKEPKEKEGKMLNTTFANALEAFDIHDVLYVFIDNALVPYDACAWWWKTKSALMNHTVTACQPNGYGGYILYIKA